MPDLEDGVALAGGRVLRRVALLGLEGFGEDLGGVRKRGDQAPRADQRRGHHLQVMSRGGFLQAVFACLGGERLGVALFSGGRLLAGQHFPDGRLNLAERLAVRRLPLFHLHEVVAEGCLHDPGVADLLGEDGVFKLRHHHAAPGKAQFAALVFAAGVIGVLLCQFGEVGSALNPPEQRLRFGLAAASVLASAPRATLMRMWRDRACSGTEYSDLCARSTAESPAGWATALRPAPDRRQRQGKRACAVPE